MERWRKLGYAFVLQTSKVVPMKALFAHDHRFILSDGEVWSESQFEATLWTRYLNHFHTLTVAARCGRVPAGKTVTDLERSSRPRVAFELFANLSSARGLTLARPAARARMAALVARHQAVIARLPSEIGLLAIDAAQRSGTPFAVEVVGCPWDGLVNYGSLAGKIYAPLAMQRMRRAVGASNHALYVTKSFLQARYPSCAANTVVASNVILSDVADAALAKRKARIKAGQAGVLKLGLIGTLRGRFKGIQTVLAALEAERGALPDAALHVLGGGDPTPWRAEADARGIGDIVHFDGTRPAGQPVLDWLDGVDLYLQPSLKEGLPRALIEAMSRGLPAIASTIAGIPELLPAEDLIVPGDAARLGALLRQRAGDQAWMLDRAERNFAEAQEYREEVLATRRDVFWGTFAKDAGAAAT